LPLCGRSRFSKKISRHVSREPLFSSAEKKQKIRKINTTFVRLFSFCRSSGRHQKKNTQEREFFFFVVVVIKRRRYGGVELPVVAQRIGSRRRRKRKRSGRGIAATTAATVPNAATTAREQQFLQRDAAPPILPTAVSSALQSSDALPVSIRAPSASSSPVWYANERAVFPARESWRLDVSEQLRIGVF
jgi:hypothetical protein